MKIELKNCPFCDCSNVIAEVDFEHKEFRIYCETCPATMVLTFADADLGQGYYIGFEEISNIIEELVSAWNKRPD